MPKVPTIGLGQRQKCRVPNHNFHGKSAFLALTNIHHGKEGFEFEAVREPACIASRSGQEPVSDCCRCIPCCCDPHNCGFGVVIFSDDGRGVATGMYPEPSQDRVGYRATAKSTLIRSTWLSRRWVECDEFNMNSSGSSRPCFQVELDMGEV